MAQLQRELPGAGLLSFSVDPAYDSPQVLSGYAERYEADGKRWMFLTGDHDVLNRITVALKMNPIGDPAFHSTRLVLLDASGQVRGYYDAGDEERIEALRKDVRQLSRRA